MSNENINAKVRKTGPKSIYDLNAHNAYKEKLLNYIYHYPGFVFNLKFMLDAMCIKYTCESAGHLGVEIFPSPDIEEFRNHLNALIEKKILKCSRADAGFYSIWHTDGSEYKILLQMKTQYEVTGEGHNHVRLAHYGHQRRVEAKQENS